MHSDSIRIAMVIFCYLYLCFFRLKEKNKYANMLTRNITNYKILLKATIQPDIYSAMIVILLT